jgi:hypothetical protein
MPPPTSVVGIHKLDPIGKLAQLHEAVDMAIFIAFGVG